MSWLFSLRCLSRDSLKLVSFALRATEVLLCIPVCDDRMNCTHPRLQHRKHTNKERFFSLRVAKNQFGEIKTEIEILKIMRK